MNMTEKTPNWELLKDAYAILDGIPERAIYLDCIRKRGPRSQGCGAIACGIGWLGMHPKFQALGVKTVGEGYRSRVEVNGTREDYVDAAAALFNIEKTNGKNLFSSAGNSDYDPAGDWGWHCPADQHKEVLLRRFRHFLGDAGQITNPVILAQYEQEKKEQRNDQA